MIAYFIPTFYNFPFMKKFIFNSSIFYNYFSFSQFQWMKLLVKHKCFMKSKKIDIQRIFSFYSPKCTENMISIKWSVESGWAYRQMRLISSISLHLSSIHASINDYFISRQVWRKQAVRHTKYRKTPVN